MMHDLEDSPHCKSATATPSRLLLLPRRLSLLLLQQLLQQRHTLWQVHALTHASFPTAGSGHGHSGGIGISREVVVW